MLFEVPNIILEVEDVLGIEFKTFIQELILVDFFRTWVRTR